MASSILDLLINVQVRHGFCGVSEVELADLYPQFVGAERALEPGRLHTLLHQRYQFELSHRLGGWCSLLGWRSSARGVAVLGRAGELVAAVRRAGPASRWPWSAARGWPTGPG
jgi:hypothetical protein